ncbi:MAG: DUF3592 domain-containing protein [Anaerolineae bacterium]|nr:DUF3592 domain-containing protein [Anaerolineae bacterium]
MGSILIIALIFAIIFGILGVVFIIVAQSAKKKAAAAAAWPTVTGRVVSVEVREHRHYDSEDHRTEYSYEPIVEYTYTVGGRQYNGSKISFGANRFDRNTAQRKAAAYPQGASVTVFYDPSDPAKAVLEPQAAGSKVFLIIGIVFAAIGLLACCGGGLAALLAQS